MDLTGIWEEEGSAASDVGTYWMRQFEVAGTQYLMWFSEQKPPNRQWGNSFCGTINGNTIEGPWADQPYGSNRGHGTLKLNVVDGNTIEWVSSPNGTYFGGRKWVRKS